MNEPNIWPDKLMIRDTGLFDDIGGGGQRIYTTAGRGYETKEYTRVGAAAIPATETDDMQMVHMHVKMFNALLKDATRWRAFENAGHLMIVDFNRRESGMAKATKQRAVDPCIIDASATT